MKEELTNEKLREADDKEIDIQELLFKYLIHWPWFVGAVIVCLIAAYVYLYIACLLYTSPSPRDSTSSRMPSSA